MERIHKLLFNIDKTYHEGKPAQLSNTFTKTCEEKVAIIWYLVLTPCQLWKAAVRSPQAAAVSIILGMTFPSSTGF